jgi:hypothetical protein
LLFKIKSTFKRILFTLPKFRFSRHIHMVFICKEYY